MTPDMLGKYEIRSTLGRGAMGVVYEGWDPIISRRVAIKTVRLPDPTDAEAQDELARFKREAQAAGRLNHPNVVGVFDYSETKDVAYIVMEFVEGKTLKGLMGDHERMALPVVARILKDVLDGLAYCHERGVVHRDIKPANIMITPEGQAKIADFGIARIESSSMTQAGTVLGTPAYMSPEQFMGVVVDARTDIYSTGVLLFQLLTGDRPFDGSMTTIMHKVLNTVPPKPSELSVTVPRSLDDVVARAMARRPEDRFPSAAAFGQALQAALAPPPVPEDGTVVQTKPLPPTPIGRAPLAAAVATANPVGATPVIAIPPASPVSGTATSGAAAKAAERSRTPLMAGVAVVVLAAGGAAAFFGTRPASPDMSASGSTHVDQPSTGASGSAPVGNGPVVAGPVGNGPAGNGSAGNGSVAVASNTESGGKVPRNGLPPIQQLKPVGTPDVAGNGEPAPQNAGSSAPPAKAQAGPTPTLYAATPQVLGASQPPVITARPSQTPAIQSPLSQPAIPTTGGFATAANSGAPATATPPTATPSTVPPATIEAQNQPAFSGAVPTGPAPSGTGSARTPDILAVAPPPQQQAMLSPAMLRPALASALAATPCSFTAGTLSPQGVADIEGVGSGAAIGALHQAAEAAAPGVTTQWAVTDIDPSYCPALNLVRPLAPEFGTPPAVTLALKDGKTALVTDDYILPTVSMPAYPAYLNVDYLVHDGTVVHLYPNKSDPSANDGHRLFPAHALVRMGLPNAREKFEGWQVYSPYGRDLIIVVASSVPLIGLRPVDPQSQSEATGPYLTALQAAIDAARKRDAKVTADAMVLDTAAKQ